PPELASIFAPQSGRVFVDAGGDDAGVTALGGMSARLKEAGYEMLYVINGYRALSQSPGEAAALLKEIEGASRLKATGIVNNSHLGKETALDDLGAGEAFAQETARLTGLPLLYSTVPDFTLQGQPPPKGFRVIRRLVTFPWE
ncbi:MAG: ParA family protein, partial [Acutalibacter sp.]|nr:ParA family protein [Acutalibacter sp.]